MSKQGAKICRRKLCSHLHHSQWLRCRVFETTSISGEELRELIVEKWGRSYDTRLHKRGRRHASFKAFSIQHAFVKWKHVCLG